MCRYLLQDLKLEAWSPVPFPLHRERPNESPYSIIKLSPRPYVDPKIIASASSNLPYLSGSVKFSSPCALALQSTFLIYLNDTQTPLHSGIAQLKCLWSATKQSGWLLYQKSGILSLLAYKFSYQEPGEQTSFNAEAPSRSAPYLRYHWQHHLTSSWTVSSQTIFWAANGISRNSCDYSP